MNCVFSLPDGGPMFRETQGVSQGPQFPGYRTELSHRRARHLAQNFKYQCLVSNGHPVSSIIRWTFVLRRDVVSALCKSHSFTGLPWTTSPCCRWSLCWLQTLSLLKTTPGGNKQLLPGVPQYERAIQKDEDPIGRHAEANLSSCREDLRSSRESGELKMPA